jgi:hypothetical protein
LTSPEPTPSPTYARRAIGCLTAAARPIVDHMRRYYASFTLFV